MAQVLFDRLKSNLAQCINDGTIYFVKDSNGNFTQIALGDGSKSHVVGIGPKMDDATKQELMSKLGLTISSDMGTIQLGKLANHNGVSSQKVITYERTGLGTDTHEISTVGYVQQHMKTAKTMVYAGIFNAQTKEITDYNNAIISPSGEGNVTFDYLLNGNEGETLLTPGMSFIVGTAGDLEGYTGVSVFGGETKVEVGDMIIIINVQPKESVEGGSMYNEASILIIQNTNLKISDGAITTAKLADESVTASKLSTDIQSLIRNISKTATYAGIATPTTNPGTPDGHVFYIATTAGSYSNFSNIEVLKGETVILKWNSGTWEKSSLKPMTDFDSVFDADGKTITLKNEEQEQKIFELEKEVFGVDIMIEWELGSISNISGAETDSTTRYRTGFLPTASINSIVCRAHNVVVFYNESKEKTTAYVDIDNTITHEGLVADGVYVRLVDKKIIDNEFDININNKSLSDKITELSETVNAIEVEIDPIKDISKFFNDKNYIGNVTTTDSEGKISPRVTENISKNSIIEVSFMANSAIDYNVADLLFWTSVNPQVYTRKQGIKCDGTKYRFMLDEDIVRISVSSKNLVPVTQAVLSVDVLSKIGKIEKDVDALTKKPMSGQTIVVFGDSVTEFGEGTPYSDGKKVYYTDYIADITGANVINLGIGGTRIIPRSTSMNNTTDPLYQKIEITESIKAAADGVGSSKRAEYASAIDGLLQYGKDLTSKKVTMQSLDLAKVDIVVVFGGTNDWSSGNKAEDIKACLKDAIEYLWNAYPHLQILIVTPTKRWGNTIPGTNPAQIDPTSWSDTYTREGAFDLLPNIVNTLNELAQEESICSFDAYRVIGFNKANWEHYFYNHATNAISTVHPNWLGIKQIGERLSSFLLSNYIKK